MGHLHVLDKWQVSVVLLLIGPPQARPPGDNGYHFVFMPSHLFPAYPSYRWGAIVADRYEDSACSQPKCNALCICHVSEKYSILMHLLFGPCSHP